MGLPWSDETLRAPDARAWKQEEENLMRLKKNQNAPRPSDHPPVRGKNVNVTDLTQGYK